MGKLRKALVLLLIVFVLLVMLVLDLNLAEDDTFKGPHGTQILLLQDGFVVTCLGVVYYFFCHPDSFGMSVFIILNLIILFF